MVTPDKKKHFPPDNKIKGKIVDAIIVRPRQENAKKRLYAALKKETAKGPRRPSVVSAIVFDKEKKAPLSRREHIRNFSAARRHAGRLGPARDLFAEAIYDLTFANRVRNVIEYTFECLRDSVADQIPMAPYLKRSIAELKTLSLQAHGRLTTDTLRRFSELIEETEAFVKGEKTALTNTDDMVGVLHYRHYVRIAWLTHFILGDLRSSGI